jgi:hypothetical protein
MKPVRRILTGHNEKGESIILEQDDAPNRNEIKDIAGFVWTELWTMDKVPGNNDGNDDAVAGRPVKLHPDDGGLIFRTVDLPPDEIRFPPDKDRIATASAVQGGDAYAAGANSRHPGFHKTRTVDLAIVLEGEIYAMMDVGETKMEAGDILIQRGTNHAWSNRSGKVCRMAFVLIDSTN